MFRVLCFRQRVQRVIGVNRRRLGKRAVVEDAVSAAGVVTQAHMADNAGCRVGYSGAVEASARTGKQFQKHRFFQCRRIKFIQQIAYRVKTRRRDGVYLRRFLFLSRFRYVFGKCGYFPAFKREKRSLGAAARLKRAVRRTLNRLRRYALFLQPLAQFRESNGGVNLFAVQVGLAFLGDTRPDKHHRSFCAGFPAVTGTKKAGVCEERRGVRRNIGREIGTVELDVVNNDGTG